MDSSEFITGDQPTSETFSCNDVISPSALVKNLRDQGKKQLYLTQPTLLVSEVVSPGHGENVPAVL